MNNETTATTDRPQILIVRLSAVGDCVQTMPLAVAIKEHFPQAQLTWAVEPAAAPLVGAVPAVDRVLVVPKRAGRSMHGLWHLRQELHRQRFDICFDPQGLTKSGLVAWLSRAPKRIGFARPAAREINPWMQTELVVSQAAHRVDRYLELLRPLGIERASVKFGLQIPPAANTAADALIEQHDLRSGYVALNPGAGWDSKRWPESRFANVAQHLARRGLRSVVVWGGNRERAWAQAIANDSAGAAVIAPATSLLELAAVLRRARLVVSADTGPLHLAAALGTPCVGLFGSSDAAACGQYGGGHVVLQRTLDVSAGRKRPGADNWAMRQISAAAVCDACDRLLIVPRRAPVSTTQAA